MPLRGLALLLAAVVLSASSLGCSASSSPLQPTTAASQSGVTSFKVLQPGTTLSDRLANDGSHAYVGEVYESDYCAPCKFYSLAAPSDADVRIDLNWTGSGTFGLWSNRSGTVMNGQPGSAPATLSVTITRGSTVSIFVGAPFGTGPASLVPFNISASVLPG